MTRPRFTFSDMETKIIAAMTLEQDKKWTISQLAQVAYKGRKRPPNWRGSIAAIMRILTMKTYHSDIEIRRSTPLGRGHIARYKLYPVPSNNHALSKPEETR